MWKPKGLARHVSVEAEGPSTARPLEESSVEAKETASVDRSLLPYHRSLLKTVRRDQRGSQRSRACAHS